MLKECKVCKKEFEISNYYFNKSASSKDGFSSTCRECQYDRIMFVEEGFKVCGKCQQILPKENKYFHSNKSTLDGFNNKCRVCNDSAYEKEVDYSVKTCAVCNKEFPRTTEYFHVNNERLDGLSSKCKKCLLCKDLNIDNIEDWYNNKNQKFKNRWSINDIKWLYENYLNKEKKDILDYFNNDINYKTITNIVYNMGLRKTDKNDVWSKEDIEFLKANYPNMSQEKLQERLPNRTWHSIKTKASKLKIHRDEETISKIISECHRGIKLSEETKRRLSINRTGSKSNNWKGGLSPIVHAIRKYVTQWKLDSLEHYNYKCSITNINDGTLQVHHVNKNFSEIMYEAFEELELKVNPDLSSYTDDELLRFKNKIIELHYHYGLGIPLTTKLHKLFHKEYGLKNNSYSQFEEFKERLLNGDLNNYIS